jgi:hypothetical protein
MTTEQRKKMQAELVALNKKIAALEALLNGYNRKKSHIEMLLART